MNKQNTMDSTIAGLEYIADSPSVEHGGFHPKTIEIAKAALARISKLQTALREIRDLDDPHFDEFNDEDLEQDPGCFCSRCIAVRALLPNDQNI